MSNKHHEIRRILKNSRDKKKLYYSRYPEITVSVLWHLFGNQYMSSGYRLILFLVEKSLTNINFLLACNYIRRLQKNIRNWLFEWKLFMRFTSMRNTNLRSIHFWIRSNGSCAWPRLPRSKKHQIFVLSPERFREVFKHGKDVSEIYTVLGPLREVHVTSYNFWGKKKTIENWFFSKVNFWPFLNVLSSNLISLGCTLWRSQDHGRGMTNRSV